MDLPTGRTVIDKRCKLVAEHVEHYWYDAKTDKYARCTPDGAAAPITSEPQLGYLLGMRPERGGL